MGICCWVAAQQLGSPAALTTGVTPRRRRPIRSAPKRRRTQATRHHGAGAPIPCQPAASPGRHTNSARRPGGLPRCCGSLRCGICRAEPGLGGRRSRPQTSRPPRSSTRDVRASISPRRRDRRTSAPSRRSVCIRSSARNETIGSICPPFRSARVFGLRSQSNFGLLALARAAIGMYFGSYAADTP